MFQLPPRAESPAFARMLSMMHGPSGSSASGCSKIRNRKKSAAKIEHPRTMIALHPLIGLIGINRLERPASAVIGQPDR